MEKQSLFPKEQAPSDLKRKQWEQVRDTGLELRQLIANPTVVTSHSRWNELVEELEAFIAASDIGIEMMKCRGQGLFWNSLPWAVIPVAHVPEFRTDPGSWDRPHSVVATSIAAEPPEPPPRLA